MFQAKSPAVWRFYWLPVMCSLLISLGGCSAQSSDDLGRGEATQNRQISSAKELVGLKKAFAEAEKLAMASAAGAPQVAKAYRDIVLRCGADLENGPNAEVLAIRARCFLRLKDYDAANRDLAAALDLDPNLAAAYATRGRIQQVLGQPVAALADYDAAIALDAHCAFARNNRAIFYQQAGRLAEARADLKALLSAHPRHYKGYYNLGLVWRALGDSEAAVSACNRALEIHPGFRWALKNRGNALIDLGRYDEALQDYDAALAITPQDAVLYTARAAARMRKSLAPMEQLGLKEVAEPRRAERDAVLADLATALRLDPKNSDAWLLHALLRRGAGDLETALADLTQVLSLDAKNDAAFMQRGITYQLASKPTAALEDFSRAVALQPNNPAYHQLRGEIQLELGNATAAAADITRAAQLQAVSGREPADSRK